MKPAAKSRAVVSLALVHLALPACGLFAPAQTRTQVAKTAAPIAAKGHKTERAPVEPRKVGDFAVHRFSGSYQKSPLTLTEEVVGQEFGLWVIDYTFEEQEGTTKLRVRFNPRTEAVFSVAKLDGTQEVSVPISVYEQLIERTSFAADANDGMIASSHATCLVGPNELDCETKTYKVRVGEKSATLSVSRSERVASGDVTGDITADDGSVIYRSELVEMGNSGSPQHDVASR
jgi:hypothetical protein